MASQSVPTDKPTGTFHPIAEYSATLPSHYYCDPAIHELEKEKIFYRAWQYSGALEDLQNPGDYVTSKLFDQQLLVVRAKSGELRAFYNVCMHRGHILAEGKGNKTIFTCPFHAWSYDTTGALKAAGNAENVAGFQLEDFGLSEIRVEEFLNMAFVNLDPDARSMRDMYGALEDEIMGYMPDVKSFTHARTDIFELKCNWKFVLDQLECYHCPHIHPEAMAAVDITKRDSWEYDGWQSHISYIDDSAMNDYDDRVLRSKDSDTFKDNHVWYLWPNYLILGQPGPANLSLVPSIPTSEESVRVEVINFFPGEPSPESIHQMDTLRDFVFPQDTAAMERQQVGVRSRGYKQGRLMVDKEHSWRSEHATHHFDAMVWEALNGPNY